MANFLHEMIYKENRLSKCFASTFEFGIFNDTMQDDFAKKL